MFPKLVQFTSAKARTLPRGSVRFMSNEEFKMVAIGRLDSNPVHMILTVDGTKMTHMNRLMNGTQQSISAPAAISNYNNHMQAVDRHNQLRSSFALCS